MYPIGRYFNKNSWNNQNMSNDSYITIWHENICGNLYERVVKDTFMSKTRLYEKQALITFFSKTFSNYHQLVWKYITSEIFSIIKLKIEKLLKKIVFMWFFNVPKSATNLWLQPYICKHIWVCCGRMASFEDIAHQTMSYLKLSKKNTFMDFFFVFC